MIHATLPPRSARLAVHAILLVLCCLVSSGCSAMGWGAYIVGGDEKTLKVKSQYDGLAGKRFAVMVAADEYVQFSMPNIQSMVCQAISRRIAEKVGGSEPLDAQTISTYMDRNPYWTTASYHQIFEKLKVDRLVIVDIVEYAMHEPGNPHVWQGSAVANVSVAERDLNEPGNLAFSSTVKTVYPKGTSLGSINPEPGRFQLDMLNEFSTGVANLFHKHEEKVPR